MDQDFELYKWDFETITDQIPGLVGYDEHDARLRKINKQMGKSLKSLLNGVRDEISVVFGKKKNMFDMTDDELSKQSLDKLVQYYDILGHSLIEMVKKGKLNKMKILNVAFFCLD